MPAPNSSYQIQEMPLKIVGGVHYGRYPKISDEQTWNFIISDGFLVPYAGYKNVKTISETALGRGIYSSFRSGYMYVVVGDSFFQVSKSYQVLFRGPLSTNKGDVYMAENNNNEICITDGSFVYVWDYVNLTYKTSDATLSGVDGYFDFQFSSPGYISFQNGNFIVACQGTTNWALSGFNEGTTWTDSDPAYVGSLQTKPDYVQAVVPVPGGGNNVLVFGRNVAELWQRIGNTALFPYQRNASFNSDFGCISPASIASLNDTIVWIGVNENTGPVLMTYERSQINEISTDGIDFKLGNLKYPSNCTGFLYLQDGHLLYQFTFPKDNLSYVYDFNSKEFFSVSDPYLNYHIARQVVYFGNTYFFVSLTNGKLYRFDTIYPYADEGEGSTLDIKVIPRIRITPPLRLPTQRYFIINNVEFTIEQGQPNRINDVVVYSYTYDNLSTESGVLITTEGGDNISTEQQYTPTAVAEYQTSEAAVFLSVSRDGGESFGNQLPLDMNPTGRRKSRFIFQRLGLANDATFQLRFVGPIRFVCTDGLAEIYQ